MFSIEYLEMVSVNKEVFRYRFKEGLNYIQGSCLAASPMG